MCLIRRAPLLAVCLFFFFFQAEDGIRDGRVTGVQTCALPIFVLPGSGTSSATGTEPGRTRSTRRLPDETVPRKVGRASWRGREQGPRRGAREDEVDPAAPGRDGHADGRKSVEWGRR